MTVVAASLLELFQTETPEEALESLLAIAAAVELPTTAWAAGDTTLSILETVAQKLSLLTGVVEPALAGGLLDSSGGDWLTLLAKQVFGEDRIVSTFAGTPVTLTNAADSDTYTISANDLTFENSSTNKTYRNSSPTSGTVVLAPGASVDLDVVADEAGSDSSASAGEIDTLVSTLVGVTVANASAAVGLDAETDDHLKARCRLKVPAISTTAASPEGKYAYVAITPAENGGANVTRCVVRGDQMDGSVTVVIAGPSGAVSSDDRDLVELALVTKVIGPVETLTVLSASNVIQTIGYTMWVYSDINLSAGDISDKVDARLALLFAIAPIGAWKKTGDTAGRVWRNLIEKVIMGVSDRVFEVELATPATDAALGINEVATLGSTEGDIHFETPPTTGGAV